MRQPGRCRLGVLSLVWEADGIRMTPGRPDGKGRTAKIAVIAGDGIGPEVIEAAIPILDRVAAKHGFSLAWERLPYSADHYLKTKETLPDAAFQHLRDDVDAIFLGALGDPRVPGNEHARDILLGLRFKLDLYVNFRPVELLHADLTPLRATAVDFVIFRENTEGQYLGRGRSSGDEYIAEEVNTGKGVERIIRAAFAWAQSHGKRRVTMSDKSNAIPAHRIWQDKFKAIAREYPQITAEHRYVDALALELVHGSAPALAGKGVANPVAAVLTGGLMFEYLGYPAAAADLKQAVGKLLASKVRTPDLGGDASTAAVVKKLGDLV